MVFNSLNFLIFFTILLFCYHKLDKTKQNYLLLISSYIFYSFWNLKYSFLILISTLVDFYCGKKSIEKKGKFYLYFSIIINLGLLIYFKYSLFLSELIFTNRPEYILNNILLPVGISFYTFQSMSYTIDCYNKKIKPVNSFTTFALYVSYFPQMVAGPIERANRLLPQFSNKRVSFSKLKNGFNIILIGLVYKIVLADNLSQVVDEIFFNYKNLNGGELTLGALYFGGQIYGDFLGYSLIAIGTSKMLGIKLINNFNRPYSSSSIEEFWRKWHISLSEWFRDYVYLQLGGNKKNKNFNIFCTFLLSGIWHGANLTFVVWGAYHGVLRILSKWFKFKSKYLNILITFILIHIGWIFFRSNDVLESIDYIKNIFMNFNLNVQFKSWLVFLFMFYFIELVPKKKLAKFIIKKNIVFMFICFMLIIYHLSKNKTNFIYFQF